MTATPSMAVRGDDHGVAPEEIGVDLTGGDQVLQLQQPGVAAAGEGLAVHVDAAEHLVQLGGALDGVPLALEARAACWRSSRTTPGSCGCRRRRRRSVTSQPGNSSPTISAISRTR